MNVECTVYVWMEVWMYGWKLTKLAYLWNVKYFLSLFSIWLGIDDASTVPLAPSAYMVETHNPNDSSAFQSKSLRIWPPALLDKRNFLSPWLWDTTLSWFFSQTSGYLFVGFSSFSASPQELRTHSCSSTHPIQIGGKCCHYSNELFWWCLPGEHIVSTDLPPPAGRRSQLVLFRNSARLHLSPSS